MKNTTRSMQLWLVGGALSAAAAVVAVGCGYDCGDQECNFNKSEWALVNTMGPLPEPPADLTNKYWDHAGAAVLGQKLFFEKRYAGPLRIAKTDTNGGLGAKDETGKVACASCHIPESDFIDTRTNPNNVSLGTGYTLRNTPSIINTAYFEWHGWTGRQDSLMNQASTSPESADNTGGDRCDYAHMLWDHYRDEYNAVFDEDLPVELGDTTSESPRFPAKCKPKSNAMAPDGNWEKMPKADKEVILRIMANWAKAIGAYEWKLVSRNSPFDKYVMGDMNAISGSAKRGLNLFMNKAACMDCHKGMFFCDQIFHNLGIPQEGPNVPREDAGRFTDLPRLMTHSLNSKSVYVDGPALVDIEGLEPTESDKGRFRTPTLRNVAKTAPYFHTGMASTLEEVIWFYNEGGGASQYSGVKDARMVPLGLDSQEIADLVAFLETLTGEPIPADLKKNPLE